MHRPNNTPDPTIRQRIEETLNDCGLADPCLPGNENHVPLAAQRTL